MKKELILSALLAVAGATESFAGNAKAETLNGRSIYVYAPANIEKNKPLLISCHGMNQDAAYQSSQARWEDVADTARFTVVYPNGINKGWDLGGDKDINLVKDIIDEMYKRYEIDLSRVYLSGFSMGGMFTYFAMGKIADKIAAFAPVSGYMMGGPGKASRPVPIIHHHGTSDDVVTYSNVMTHINAYKNQFNCPSTPSETLTFPANSKSEMWGPCDGGVSVKLVTLGGKGHWHSNDEAVVHTSKSIWNFIKNYSLDGSVTPMEPVPAHHDTIFNGSFEQNTRGWTLNTWGGEATVSAKDSVAHVDIASIGTQAYQIQLVQNGLVLHQGKNYRLTFDAKAEKNRKLELNVEQDVDPWGSYLPANQYFDLTTEFKTFTVVFSMGDVTDSNSRVSFNLGGEMGDVYLDNVKLEYTTDAPTVVVPDEPGDEPSESGDPAAIALTSPNAAVNLRALESAGKVQYFDMGGHRISNAAAKNPGVYLVRIPGLGARVIRVEK